MDIKSIGAEITVTVAAAVVAGIYTQPFIVVPLFVMVGFMWSWRVVRGMHRAGGMQPAASAASSSDAQRLTQNHAEIMREITDQLEVVHNEVEQVENLQSHAIADLVKSFQGMEEESRRQTDLVSGTMTWSTKL